MHARDALCYDLPQVLGFMRTHLPGLRPAEDMVAIGLQRRGQLVAGVLYEGINRFNAWMHVAAEPGARWLTRDYLRACFAYPFKVCGLRRVSGYVDESNAAAMRFNTHLGFREEAVLRGAAVDGGSVIVMVMWREECRFLGD
jgi:RimJ/RimL family protein N-acetyltransferase